jgi:hypothetical protein
VAFWAPFPIRVESAILPRLQTKRIKEIFLFYGEKTREARCGTASTANCRIDVVKLQHPFLLVPKDVPEKWVFPLVLKDAAREVGVEGQFLFLFCLSTIKLSITPG